MRHAFLVGSAIVIVAATRLSFLEDDIFADEVIEETLPDILDFAEDEPQVVLDATDEPEILKILKEIHDPNKETEEILEHKKHVKEMRIEDRTHSLLDVQYGIRMTGMWSSYHLETPRATRVVDILKMLFSSKNQTLLQGMVEKAKEQKLAKDAAEGPAIDGNSTGPSATGAAGDAPDDNRLQLVFPLEDEKFLENIHYEERDDLGIDTSALGLIEKTFVKFPDFYFNPRIHCFSPFQNETIICTTRPVAF